MPAAPLPAAPDGAGPLLHPSRAVLELAELVVDGALPELPAGLIDAPAGAPETILTDAEGTPVAAVHPDRSVRRVRPFNHPPLRGRRLPPDQALARGFGGGLAVLVDRPLTAGAIRAAAERAAGRPVLWFALVGAPAAGRPGPGLAAEALWRAVTEIAAQTGGVAVPLALPADHVGLFPRVARAYRAAQVCTAEQLIDVQPAQPHPAFARELARSQQPPARRGVVLLLTGLSGSGKSTLAKALAERLVEDGRRPVTMLDGDEVRRLLSHGLGFSRADRDLNIRRIGFVAAEVARHGGLALCAPIAPFAAVRDEVRAMVAAAGGDLLLVHVATPLAECERRDRKGLYARARRGEIPDFTGISSAYEPPLDADLVLDTTGRPVADGVDAIWRLLAERGYLAGAGRSQTGEPSR